MQDITDESPPLQTFAKLTGKGPAPKTPAQALPRESRKTPKKTHFQRAPPVAASKQMKILLSILDKILYLHTHLNSSFLLILSSNSNWSELIKTDSD